MTLEELAVACKQNDRVAQQALYKSLSPKMFAVCKRYLKDSMQAEDALIQGFYKVFKNIHSFEFKGSFEGWVRRIMVNESLMIIRKNKVFLEDIDQEVLHMETGEDVLEQMKAQDILNLLPLLPDGYRTIFNLYVLEGYKHKEIAEKLGISINTSKSQLIQAKKRLRTLLSEHKII